MTRAAVAPRAVVELGWVGACVGQKVLQRCDVQAFGCVGIHHQHIGDAQHLGDGRKVGGRVVGHAAIKPRVHGMRRGGCDANHRTVRRGLRHDICADVAASARTVFDDHRA